VGLAVGAAVGSVGLAVGSGVGAAVGAVGAAVVGLAVGPVRRIHGGAWACMASQGGAGTGLAVGGCAAGAACPSIPTDAHPQVAPYIRAVPRGLLHREVGGGGAPVGGALHRQTSGALHGPVLLPSALNFKV
jgi:hypothetical protein